MFTPHHPKGSHVRVSLNGSRVKEMIGTVDEVSDAALLLRVTGANGGYESWVVPWPTIKSIDYMDSPVKHRSPRI